MIKKLFLAGIFIITNLIVSAQENQQDWATYETNIFSVKYPTDYYRIDTSGNLDTKFIFYALQQDRKDVFGQTISLEVQDLSDADIDLETFKSVSEEQMQFYINDLKTVASSVMQDAHNNQFYKSIYTGKQEKFKLKWQEWVWMKNGFVYILKFTCEEKVYDKYAPQAEKVMQTFLLK